MCITRRMRLQSSRLRGGRRSPSLDPHLPRAPSGKLARIPGRSRTQAFATRAVPSRLSPLSGPRTMASPSFWRSHALMPKGTVSTSSPPSLQKPISPNCASGMVAPSPSGSASGYTSTAGPATDGRR